MFLIIAIATANKANEERLNTLQKSADLYRDRLGLEIRKIHGRCVNIMTVWDRSPMIPHSESASLGLSEGPKTRQPCMCACMRKVSGLKEQQDTLPGVRPPPAMSDT